MIQLDYRTDNPRWGLSGVIFRDWYSYTKTIGFLCNKEHYISNFSGDTNFSKTIEIHREENHTDGAWDRELRIHYYGDADLFIQNLPDLAKCSSAGRGDITCRINSNSFVFSLISDYGFIDGNDGYINNIVPPNGIYKTALDIIHNNLKTTSYDNSFIDGWNL